MLRTTCPAQTTGRTLRRLGKHPSRNHKKREYIVTHFVVVFRILVHPVLHVVNIRSAVFLKIKFSPQVHGLNEMYTYNKLYVVEVRRYDEWFREFYWDHNCVCLMEHDAIGIAELMRKRMPLMQLAVKQTDKYVDVRVRIFKAMPMRKRK